MKASIRNQAIAADTGCLFMLSMAALLSLGLYSPRHALGVSEPLNYTVPAETSNVSSEPVESTDSEWSPIPMEPLVGAAAQRPVSAAPQRPVSLAEHDAVEPVLGAVNARVLLPPARTTAGVVRVTRLNELVGNFNGVGFPDIRTYHRAAPSPFDEPGPWAPLVAWRAVEGGESRVEPIARVWCMGLPPHAVARRADRYRAMIYDYAQRYAVSPHLVKAVITEESCFNNQALSPVGAQGLMQLMPETAVWLNVQDPHDPAQNLRAGVRYLASLQKQFDTTELALAAYNAGPGNVRRYDGVPPFAETQAYVVKVQAHYRRYKAAHRLLYSGLDTVQTSDEAR